MTWVRIHFTGVVEVYAMVLNKNGAMERYI